MGILVGIKKMRPVLIPLKPVSSNNLLKYSLNKSELVLLYTYTVPKTIFFDILVKI